MGMVTAVRIEVDAASMDGLGLTQPECSGPKVNEFELTLRYRDDANILRFEVTVDHSWRGEVGE